MTFHVDELGFKPSPGPSVPRTSRSRRGSPKGGPFPWFKDPLQTTLPEDMTRCDVQEPKPTGRGKAARPGVAWPHGIRGATATWQLGHSPMDVTLGGAQSHTNSFSPQTTRSLSPDFGLESC